MKIIGIFFVLYFTLINGLNCSIQKNSKGKLGKDKNGVAQCVFIVKDTSKTHISESKSNWVRSLVNKNKRTSLNKENLDLYLLIGQSNMAGRAPIKAMQRDTLQHVFLFNGNRFVPASNPLNKYSTVRKRLSMQKLGPGYSFGQELTELTGKNIGLIVNARGGTRIEWWQKEYNGHNDFNLYKNAIKAAKEAEKYGDLKAILWLQGYANRKNAKDYMSLLMKLVRNLRHDVGENLYFIAGELPKWQSITKKMNKVIDQIPYMIPNADYVSSDGLTPLHGDTTNPHLNTKSQLILGERYAIKVLKEIYHIDLCP